jgi:hypothetical protein
MLSRKLHNHLLAVMRTVSNSAIERYYFEQFRTHYPVPDGEVEYMDKPDVVLHGVRRLGVEIANLYVVDGKDATSEQIQRGLRESTLKQAQSRYAAAGGKNIELTVSFNRRHPIRDAKAVASALAKVAPSIAAMPAGSVARHAFSQIPELAFIYHNPTEYIDSKWRVAQSFTVPSLAVDRLLEIVDAKHGKLSGYTHCDAYWLLLIVDFADSAQDQDISWPETAEAVVSPFEKIIVYKPQFAAWCEVPSNQ